MTYSTIKGKAKALSRQFYLNVKANISNVRLKLCKLGTREELEIKQQVITDNIQAVLRSAKPDKCLGVNKIPNCFLQTIRELLVKAMQSLITVVIKLSYFLRRF